ncbi:hypothetical protein RJ55_00134 [Drechmeria coniospora]|nr:hypothetical protein RJ55_00134 [Drechmeria coniospora]
MHGTVTATAQENADFHEQNNTLSRQLDLQYHQIRQHSENTSSQISALLHLIETQSTVGQGVTNSLNILNNVASQLTHAVTNVPHFVGNLVQSSVAPTVQKIVSRGTQTTLDLAISAERQIDSISNNHSEQSAQLERQWDEISNQLAVILQEIRHQPQRLHSVEMESLRQDDVAEDEVKQNKRGVLQEVELSRKCGSRDVKFFFKKLLKIVDRKMERMASSS